MLLPLIARSASRRWSAIAWAARWRSPRRRCARVAGLALIAAPWRFAGYPEEARADLAALWRSAEPSPSARAVADGGAADRFLEARSGTRRCQICDYGRLDPTARGARGFVALEDWATTARR